MKRIITIDEFASDNGVSKTQAEHIRYHNKHGTIMMCASDWYNGSYSDEALQSMQRDCRESVLRLSDKFFYNKNDLKTRIIIHYKSRVIEPRSVIVKVPVLGGKKLKNVLSQSDGREFMQLWLKTKDKSNKMISRFEKLSCVDSDDIYIYTLNMKSRKDYPERASGFYYVGGFHVGGDLNLDCLGRSRGVRYSAEGAELENNPQRNLIRLIKEYVPENVRSKFLKELRKLRK